MKVAEALIERADAQKRLAELNTLILSSTHVAEGETPDEDVARLLKEFANVNARLEQLTTAINYTNIYTVGEWRKQRLSVTALIALRDSIARERTLYQALAKKKPERERDRYNGEVNLQLKLTYDRSVIRTEADHLARTHRLLDTYIQSLNWTTEIML